MTFLCKTPLISTKVYALTGDNRQIVSDNALCPVDKTILRGDNGLQKGDNYPQAVDNTLLPGEKTLTGPDKSTKPGERKERSYKTGGGREIISRWRRVCNRCLGWHNRKIPEYS